jgi:predicted permease
LDLPEIIDKTLSSFAKMASPLALITIGAGFEGRKAIAKIKPTVIASAIKLIVLPAVFLPIAVKMGFRDQALVALIIMLGSPTTPSSYIMAKNMGNDGVLSSSVVVLATLLSSVTLTFWIFLLRVLQLI